MVITDESKIIKEITDLKQFRINLQNSLKGVDEHIKRLENMKNGK